MTLCVSFYIILCYHWKLPRTVCFYYVCANAATAAASLEGFMSVFSDGCYVLFVCYIRHRHKMIVHVWNAIKKKKATVWSVRFTFTFHFAWHLCPKRRFKVWQKVNVVNKLSMRMKNRVLSSVFYKTLDFPLWSNLDGLFLKNSVSLTRQSIDLLRHHKC